MSICHIDQPASGTKIPGHGGFLWVYAYNNSGDVAYLNCKCIRQSPYHVFDLPWVGLPHDPAVGWYIIFPRKHTVDDATTLFTMTARLIDSLGFQIGYSVVSNVGIDPPYADEGDHEKFKAKDAKSHWLTDATKELFPAAVDDKYYELGGSKVLGGLALKSTKMTVSGRIRLPLTNLNREPAFQKFLDPIAVGEGKPWTAPLTLTTPKNWHGATAVVTFQNPAEPNPLVKNVLVSIPLLDPAKVSSAHTVESAKLKPLVFQGPVL